MVNVLVPVADGTEELEAVTIIDILRRAGADVCIASVMTSKRITASRGVTLEAEVLIPSCVDTVWDLIALPGGMPGAEHLQNCSTLQHLLGEQFSTGRFVAAICASPAVVLGRNGFLKGRRATCYPSFQDELQQYGAISSSEKIVVDENLVTSQGPGTALAFSLKLVELVFDKNVMKSVTSDAVA
ncbi:DJ-1 family glyoxalase III [Teredinibacter haidensis]|uniref:DJ-1 family glyoxalase III n=1 Tax=Teredinibacter haidensis TaxID=2731755 RepID=UPI000948AC4B|nr:DJ-1 family glyoxalase III [Teredinibacter haidensis]